MRYFDQKWLTSIWWFIIIANWLLFEPLLYDQKCGNDSNFENIETKWIIDNDKLIMNWFDCHSVCLQKIFPKYTWSNSMTTEGFQVDVIEKSFMFPKKLFTKVGKYFEESIKMQTISLSFRNIDYDLCAHWKVTVS